MGQPPVRSRTGATTLKLAAPPTWPLARWARSRCDLRAWAILVVLLRAGSTFDAVRVASRSDDRDIHGGVVSPQRCERHPGVTVVVGGIGLNSRYRCADLLLGGGRRLRPRPRFRDERDYCTAHTAAALSHLAHGTIEMYERRPRALDAERRPRCACNDDIRDRVITAKLRHGHSAPRPMVCLIRHRCRNGPANLPRPLLHRAGSRDRG
jgi:hypothetical protein